MNKKNMLFVSALCALAIGGGALAQMTPTVSPVAQTTVETTENIKTEYLCGEEFIVPDGTLQIGENRYPATETTVIFPNGRAYANDNFVLEQAGRYTVLYSATVNGKRLKAEKTFFVHENLYDVTSGLSTVSYAPLTKSDTATMGLRVALAEGDEFTFNQPIDLMKDGAFDFIKFYPHSFSKIDESGNAVLDGMQLESNFITVTLTDCYDETNYVDFVLAYCSTGATNPQKAIMPYFQAGAFGQQVLGLEHNETKNVDGVSQKEIYLDGWRYISRYDGKFGALAERTADGRGYALAYDSVTSRVTMFDGENNLVNVLNSEEIYDKPFGGFTTGEVYLSVSASEYLSNQVRFEIERIGNYAGTSLQAKRIADEKAPQISVNLRGADVDRITIAKGEPFVLFDAVATDVHLLGNVQRAVYFNYGTSLQTQVGYDGNTFTPNKTGWYSIVYTATDSTGLTATEVVDLWCVETANGQTASLQVEKVEALQAGKENVLPAHTAESVNGDVAVEIFALSEGEREEIDPLTRIFVPRDIGTYTLVYKYADCLHGYEYSYEVVSVSSDGVVAEKAFCLPEYFLKGVAYTLDDIRAYTFDGDARQMQSTKLYVVEDGNGSGREIDPAEYVVTANESVQFLLYFGETLLQSSDVIPVVDVGSNGALRLEKYFVGDFTANKRESSIDYYSISEEGNAELHFVNPLFLSNFYFQFELLANGGNFERINVSLIDYYDREKVMTVSYRNFGEYYVVEMGNSAYTVYQELTGVKQSIQYVPSTNSFSVVRGDKARDVKNDVEFTTGRLLLHVEFVGMSNRCGLSVLQVGNQAFTRSVLSDLSLPMVSYSTSAGRYEKGATITVYKIDALDVLSSIVKKNMQVFVMDENNRYLTSVDNVTLNGVSADREYQVRLDEFGTYTVFYTVKDHNNRLTPVSYTVTVADNVAPTLSLENGYGEDMVKYVKVGSKVTVATATASDDMDGADVTLFTVVLDPTNSTTKVTDGSFIANYKGTYKVCYFAYDKTGNFTSTYYTVQVQ